MANCEDFKKIAQNRISAAKVLLDNGDWHMASYIFGLSLECALKAVICKTLKLDDYPEGHKDKKTQDFFMTHHFDRLFLLSGLNDIISVNGDPLAFQNWSDFTTQFLGEWVSMRYFTENQNFDENTAKKLYVSLFDDEHSIIKIIDEQKRW